MMTMSVYPPLMYDGAFMKFPVGAIMEVQMSLDHLFGNGTALAEMQDLVQIEQLIQNGSYQVQPFNTFEAETLLELRCAILHRLHAVYEHYARGRLDFDTLSHFVQVLTATLHEGEARDWDQDEPMIVSLRPF